MKKTFFSHAFGCRVNQAEKEELDRQLIQLGYTYQKDKPDVFIINSCSVTNKAEREARQLVYQIKRQSPSSKIVVTGCAATNWIKQNLKVEGVDFLIDNQNKEYIATMLSKHFNASAKLSQTAKLTNVIQDKYIRSKRVIIKIQDGCHRFCTYCIVPYLRGLPNSLTIESILKKARYYEPNVNEIILTAINTEAYGRDTKESFIELVKTIIDETTIRRVSFGSIHPWSINDDFFSFYKQYLSQQRLVDFFHIPLQSGSNKMLQLMKRGYTREEFLEKLATIEKLNPFVFLATDVIVGFLEETDKDFEDTYTFMEQTPLSKFHIFRFSNRQHTAASYMAKRLKEPDPQTKQKRAKALADLSKRKYESFLQKHLKKQFSTLVLEKRVGEYQEGLLANQIPVMVKTANDFTGEIKNVQITDHKNGKLFGKII